MFVIDAEGLEYSKKLFDLAMKSMKALADSLSDHYTELIRWASEKLWISIS